MSRIDTECTGINYCLLKYSSLINQRTVHVLLILTVISPANHSKEIDDCSGRVECVVSELRRLVVPGEHVMVVVPALA